MNLAMQFRHKIIILSGGILLLSIVAFAANNYYFLADQTKKDLEGGMQELSGAVSGSIASWLNGKLDLVRGVALKAAQTTDVETIRAYAQVGAVSEEVAGMYAGLSNGTFIYNDANESFPSDYDPRKRPWYTTAQQKGSPTFSEPYRDVLTKELLITAAAPFSGSSSGVAGADLNLDVVTKMVNSVDFFGLGYAFLVTDKGKVLVHPDVKMVDKNVTDLFPKETPKLNASDLQETTSDKQSVLVSFFPISGIASVSWRLGVVIDKEKAFASLADFRNSAIVYAVIGVLVVCVLMTLLLNTLMRPVIRLGDAMENIAEGEGDLTQRLDVSGKDEFTRLATNFNAFVAKVQNLVGDIKNSIESMSAAVREMKGFAAETSEAVASQQQETEMVATAVNEMSAAAREIAQNAQQAAEAAQEADDESANVKRIVDDAIKSIEQLSTQIGSASEVINALEGDVNSIVSVLSVIRGIAEQTNLLALNAAIEAARAGEAGRGFAVVADEVRALASKTQESTEEIQAMISRLQDGSNKAVGSMEQSRNNGQAAVDKAQSAGSSLNAIVSAITTISSMNTQIAAASEEQTAVTEDISRSITSIADAAEQTARGTQETANTSTQLAELGEHLRQQVARFKV
ncbi:methyl-accepting chemotaxis protein [Hahella sp. HN01]|uniref:methyl-accepting chemotaxis protein n=1 Tax=Hahella sp. HN01 TaxID=2847262 RepID=UPI001C1EA205|nr:methyl-accepting chemotaxis protein [Hahella sp. HN01]MBU6953484.1 methyl-accepting chemotaxis protein [Hahella sp. HN01]